jgi:hypothetical protein
MEQLHLNASLDFSGFVLRSYTNSPGVPKRKHITLVLYWIEASKLFDNSISLRGNRKFFKEFKEMKPFLTQCFCKNKERKY